MVQQLSEITITVPTVFESRRLIDQTLSDPTDTPTLVTGTSRRP